MEQEHMPTRVYTQKYILSYINLIQQHHYVLKSGLNE